MGPLTISVDKSRYTLEPRNFSKITLVSARPPLAVADILKEAHFHVNSLGVHKRNKTWAAYLSQFAKGPYSVWMCQDSTRTWAALNGLSNYLQEEKPRGDLLIIPADWQIVHHWELREFWLEVLKKVYEYDMDLLVDARLADSVNWLISSFAEKGRPKDDIMGLVVSPHQAPEVDKFIIQEVNLHGMWEKAGTPEDWR